MVLSFLVVVDKLDVSGAGGAPGEADAPLVVDADAVLAGAIADSFSSRLPGGTRKSLMLSAALMRTSLLYATLLSSGLSFLMYRRCQIASVSLSRNERITH